MSIIVVGGEVEVALVDVIGDVEPIVVVVLTGGIVGSVVIPDGVGDAWHWSLSI